MGNNITGSTGDKSMDDLLGKEVTRRKTAAVAFGPYAEGAAKAGKGWSGLMNMFSGKPHTAASPVQTPVLPQPDNVVRAASARNFPKK